MRDPTPNLADATARQAVRAAYRARASLAAVGSLYTEANTFGTAMEIVGT